MGFFDTILFPIKWVVAHIMVAAHNLFTFIGMDPSGGWSWLLSIVALVVVIRIILIPLFVRQIKAQRMMQVVQPEIQKLQKKYKGKTDPASRQAMQQEMMAIYKENGTSPFASCLPLIAQMPIFFSLFRVLNALGPISRGEADPIGPLDQATAKVAESSEIFGASLSSTFLGSPNIEVKIVTAVLVVLMCATMLFQQKHLTQKNMPASALDNPMARQQKMLMYVLPLVFAVSGVSFPIGVLLYWTTSNLWSMGQQFWVIHNSPTPGSPAAIALEERRARRRARRGQPVLEDDAGTLLIEDAPEQRVSGQRQQPKRKDRAKKSPGQTAQPVEPADPEKSSPAAESDAPAGPLEDAAPPAKKPGSTQAAARKSSAASGKKPPKKK
ncbi:membrane protein insertase YidC [Pseudactinotalea sp. HY158]|uniref:membrane protein insertase YidC n=1 Tax=Pseudactinotalea sp. HY158 TaxID=2654547 RepID=UPI00129C2E8B|nr:membrane protein insertase YidC [Pseudactinotalea sp. HY158]QGH70840.1 membrane protein insertase YidC [Pseudactinotalea sp. HY158]